MLHSKSARKTSHTASTVTMPQTQDLLAPKGRPSAIPRSTSGNSTRKLEALAAARPLPRPTPGTVPATRHSRVPSEDVPLFLDTSLIPKEGESQDNDSRMQKDAEKDASKYPMASGAILGIIVPEKRPVPLNHTPDLPPQLIPELQALSSRNDRPYPSLPSISTISSPSTRFTESPAPWSASTATTTPVSLYSSSPAHVQTAPHKSKTIPQPHEPRSRLPKLTTSRTDPNSQKAHGTTWPQPEPVRMTSTARGKKSLYESPPPIYPPRTSSVRRRAREGNKNDTTSIGEALSSTGHSSTPASTTLEASPLTKRSGAQVDEIGSSLVGADTSTTHAKLQKSIRVAPPRPSRDGTTDLGESRPVVINEHKAGFNSKHRQLLASAFEDATPTRKASTRVQAQEAVSGQKSPGKLSTLSRLGMFSRKSASSSNVSPEKSGRKLSRRGPAAGTGHEGYGKYAKRGRRLSTDGSARGSDSEQSVSSVRRNPLKGLSRKNSNTSSRYNRSSQSDLDEFAASRMRPVILRGGSETSVAVTDASFDRDRVGAGTPGVASSGFDSPRATTPVRYPLQDVTNSRRNSPATFDQMPGLALRRSQRFGPGYTGLGIPSPIRTHDLVAPLYVTSQQTSQSSLAPSSVESMLPGHELHHTGHKRLPAVKMKSRKQWWNPFKKRQQVSAPIVSTLPPLTQYPEMAVSVETRLAPRPVPYYAVMESESENNTTEAISQFLAQAAESDPGSPVNEPSDDEIPTIWKRRPSVLLPAAPNRVDSAVPPPLPPPPPPPGSYVEEAASRTQEAILKQSRLAQVGRIPKVINRAERQLVPSRRSFSQPFGKVIPGETPNKPRDKINDLPNEPSRLEIETDVLPSKHLHEGDEISAKPASAPARIIGREPGMEWHAPYALPVPTAYHQSNVSSSSSSSGLVSVMGPPLVPFAGGSEVLPGHLASPRIAFGLSGDDEIWNEYDDFLDHVMSPSRSKERPELPFMAPSEPRQPAPGSSPVTGGKSWTPAGDSLATLDPRKAALDLSLTTTLPDRNVSDDIRLRHSRIRAALQSHSPLDPSSPFSMQEFLREYAGKGPESTAPSDWARFSSAAELIPSITQTSGGSVEGARVEHTHDENIDLLESEARARNPGKQSELHYASLEVARWLSFGRVLFSPAHEEIHMLPQKNVLVIDGLGNEDWSIYCAVTYEKEGAVIYDLKEDSSSSLSQRSRDSAHTPMNHHRRSVSSLSDRYPFHSAFFCAIVLRFPPAMSEAKMKSILGECRRVLEPGGHLEIILLELDIVNMGVQTRRAVRELKMRMTDLAPDLDLKPTIDNFQTMLGASGFTGLRRCIVGVPVTGRPAGSVESSSSSRSSGGSISYSRRMSGGSVAQGRSSPTRKAHNFSLNDLVADHSANADTKIGRLVSRTARSWWQHCYEADVMASGRQPTSIFSDRRVMQECKARASSFKLLIAHAQRPVFESRRRTMSEPGASALAIAGAAQPWRA